MMKGIGEKKQDHYCGNLDEGSFDPPFPHQFRARIVQGVPEEAVWKTADPCHLQGIKKTVEWGVLDQNSNAGGKNPKHHYEAEDKKTGIVAVAGVPEPNHPQNIEYDRAKDYIT
jgi:hypothetical protein